MAHTPIPFIVIGGFLGAGKTTLLNDWLMQAEGLRLAVLVNDFGAINVDAALVAQRAGDAITLSNGCVCCSIGGDLSAALIGVLQAQPPYDAIVVEASGVSDPARIAQFAFADAALEPSGVVVLVDAAAAPAQFGDARLADTMVRQLAAADLVVLNKIDLADAAAIAEAREWVAANAPRAVCVQTAQARVALAGLLPSLHRTGAAFGSTRAGCSAAAAHDHRGEPVEHALRFVSAALRPRLALTAVAWRARLEAMPPGVLRLKGFVAVAQGGFLQVQYAGRRLSLLPAPAAAATQGAVVVAIGLHGQLPSAALSALFDAEVERHR